MAMPFTHATILALHSTVSSHAKGAQRHNDMKTVIDNMSGFILALDCSALI
jgi:hypothetical protein